MDDTTGKTAPDVAPEGSTTAAPPVAAPTPAPTPAAAPVVQPASTTATPKNESKFIPRERWDELVTERNSLRDLLAQHEIDPGFVKQHEKTVAELRAEVEAERRARAEDRGLFAAGLVDEEAQDTARHVYGRLPADARPDFGTWLSGLRAEGATVPKPLQPFLSGTPAPAPAKAPSLNAGVDGNARATGAVISEDQINAIKSRMIQTGNTAEYDAHRDQILASLKKR